MSTEEKTAETEPRSFARILAEALPEHTHVSMPLLGMGQATWTWSTPAGVWSVHLDGFLASGYTLTGPGGKWTVAVARVLPVLRALGAIPAVPEEAQ